MQPVYWVGKNPILGLLWLLFVPLPGNKFGPKLQGKIILLARGKAMSAMTIREMQGQGNKQGNLNLE